MKRALVIALLGLVLAAAGYCASYFLGTASDRKLLNSPAPELAWLKKEFNLNDAEFARLCQLHASYLPHCQEMCRRIEAKNRELKELLAQANAVTPEIERKLAEAGQIRVDCQKAMLQHFYQVSQAMPPAQGKRYLQWIQEKTFLTHYGMMHDSTPSTAPHGSH